MTKIKSDIIIFYSKDRKRGLILKRIKLADRQLPNYSRREEIFNSASHVVGAVFGIYVLISCLIKAAASPGAMSIASAIVYGICTVILFMMSGIYHGVVAVPPKKVLQIIDHCCVFLMFAGTYTPILLCGLYKSYRTLAIVMLIVVYTVTAVGIVLKCIDLKRYHIPTLIMQIATGWLVAAISVPLCRAIGLKDLLLIIAGGLFYTVGAILYHKGSTKKYYHCVFHIFVLAGYFIQYLGIIDLF